MYELVNAKDIIAINQMFDKGHVVNKGSLNYAVAAANQERSWLKSTAILVRAVLIDHVFEEGNKRTAAYIIAGEFERRGILYDRDRIARGISHILRKNVINIESIQRVMKDAVKA